MKLKKYEMVIILVVFILFTYSAVAHNVEEDISEKVIRLHVIANSNTDEDQALKLKVRDEVIANAEKIIGDAKTIEETSQRLSVNLDEITNIAQNTVYKNGYNYNVVAEIKHEYFPTKVYDGFALPAGNYNGLKIKIGKATGKNWWCVVFPPLCTSAATDSTFYEFTNNEKSFVRKDGTRFVIKFKAAEIVGEIRNALC